ncbi:hypothetical protein V2A60_005647 [Cordyceps javanica]
MPYCSRIVSSGLPNVTDFHALGLAFDAATSTLFRDETTRTRARASRSLRLTWAGGRELYVSNDHYFTTRASSVLARIETYLALAARQRRCTSRWTRPTTASGRRARSLRLPFANGVRAPQREHPGRSPRSSGGRVHLYGVEADGGAHAQEADSRCRFLPDNLRAQGRRRR